MELRPPVVPIAAPYSRNGADGARTYTEQRGNGRCQGDSVSSMLRAVVKLRLHTYSSSVAATEQTAHPGRGPRRWRRQILPDRRACATGTVFAMSVAAARPRLGGETRLAAVMP